MGEVPIGAVVVRDGAVLARAHNRREIDRDPTAHAELLALRQAAGTLGDWRLDGAIVYVTLEPCAMCAGAMVLARIAACVYACPDPKGGFLGTLGDLSQVAGLNHRFDGASRRAHRRGERAAQVLLPGTPGRARRSRLILRRGGRVVEGGRFEIY